MQHWGILDLLDRIDVLIGDVDLDARGVSEVRQNRNRLQSARLVLHEARRRLERVNHETRT